MHFDTHEPMKWCFLNSKLKLDVTDERVIQYIPGCKQSLSSPLQIYVRIQFPLGSIVLVKKPWSSCLGGYLSVPDDYPLVLVCEEHVSSLGIFVA